MKLSEEYPIIFIVGSGRSGTTWLRRILKSNYKVVDNDYESSIYKVLLGPFTRSRLIWNKTWKTVLKNYEKSHLDKWIEKNEFTMLVDSVRKGNEKNPIKAKKIIKIILDNYFYENKNKYSCVLIEKSPGHVYYIEEMLQQFPTAKVLEIVRDGRDVCMSLDKLYNLNYSWVSGKLNDQIKLWKSTIGACREAKANLGLNGRIKTIKYETLMENFESTIKDIYDYCGVDLSDREVKKILLQDMYNILPSIQTLNWKNYYDKKTQKYITSKMKTELDNLNYRLT